MKLLNKKDEELYKRCDEILHYIYNPIGVQDIPEARDEYYSYLPHIYKLLKEQADKNQVTFK